MKRDQQNEERLLALLQMVEQDGATPRGEMPRADDVGALLEARDYGQAEQVREAHEKGNTPPDFSNSGGTQ